MGLCKWLFGKGFKFRINLPWPGEKNLPKATRKPPVTKEEVEKEIRDSLNKGGKNENI